MEIISWGLLTIWAYYGLIKFVIRIIKETEKREKENADYRF